MGSGGGGGSQKTETVQKAEPWPAQQKHLRRIFTESEQQYGTPLSYYPGAAVAPFSPETQQALAMQADRARAGSDLARAGGGQLMDTIRGDYLSAGNPYFEQMAGRVRGQVQPQLESRFAQSGAAGSGLANRALGMGLGDAIGALAYQNYGDERQRQLQATLLAPQYAQQDYFDIAKLGEVGAQRENLEQQQINEAMARHEFEQMEPWQRLSLYNQMVQGGYGGTTSGQTTTPGQRQPLGAGLLGGAASGAGIGMMTGNPMMAGYGALAGGGLGLLSGLF